MIYPEVSDVVKVHALTEAMGSNVFGIITEKEERWHSEEEGYTMQYLVAVVSLGRQRWCVAEDFTVIDEEMGGW